MENKTTWQVKAQSLVERNKLFVGKELLSDVSLIVGPEKIKIPAHRYVLSITSWVFYNSFYLLHLNEFIIADASVEDVRAFLEYVYTDHVTLDKNNVYALLKLAINFEVAHLEEECIGYIERHLMTIENVIDLLATATELKSTELANKTKQVIEWTILDVMKTDSFLNASRDTIELILEMNQLNCTEYQLYQGLIEWVLQHGHRDKIEPEAIKKREILDKCLFKIRFPTMSTEEFSECAKETELLNADEIRTIFLKIMKKNSDQLLLFSEENRQIKLGFHVSGIWIFNRFVKWTPNFDRQPTFQKHSTLVRVNKPVVVVGLGILMRHDDLSLTDISVHINGRQESLNEKRTELMYRLELDNGLDIVRLLLDKPVFLETDEVYLIQIVHDKGNLLEIDGQVRDTIVNEDLNVTFVKPKQSPYINSIAEVFIHKG